LDLAEQAHIRMPAEVTEVAREDQNMVNDRQRRHNGLYRRFWQQSYAYFHTVAMTLGCERKKVPICLSVYDDQLWAEREQWLYVLKRILIHDMQVCPNATWPPDILNIDQLIRREDAVSDINMHAVGV
jgi:hypothetical protein